MFFYFLSFILCIHTEIYWCFMCARCSIPNWRNSIKYLLKVNYVQTVWILFRARCFSLHHFVYAHLFHLVPIGNNKQKKNPAQSKECRGFKFFFSNEWKCFASLENFYSTKFFWHRFLACILLFRQELYTFSMSCDQIHSRLHSQRMLWLLSLVMKTIYDKCNLFFLLSIVFFLSVTWKCRLRLPFTFIYRLSVYYLATRNFFIHTKNQTIETLFS